MATEKKIIRPHIIYVRTDHDHNNDAAYWEFKEYFPDRDVPDWQTYTIPALGVFSEHTREPSSYANVYDVRYVAVHRDGVWDVARAWSYSRIPYRYVHLFDYDERMVDKLAYPVDPRMIKEDIVGATQIYPNEDNTGYLFAHASKGNHQDHELTLMATLNGLFEIAFRQYQTDLYEGTGQAVTLAKQRYSEMSKLYGEVIRVARKNARSAHLGQRRKEPHPETGHLLSEVNEAYQTVIARWEAENAAKLEILRGGLQYVKAALAIPAPETRWDKAARLKAEAAAEAKEAATNDEGQGNPQ